MKHTLNGELEKCFSEILDYLTTALLSDMERSRWSDCPTVCADLEGYGFDCTVFVNREGTTDILFATDANKENPLLEEFLKEELPSCGDLYEMCRQDDENSNSTLDEGFASWNDFFNFKQIH